MPDLRTAIPVSKDAGDWSPIMTGSELKLFKGEGSSPGPSTGIGATTPSKVPPATGGGMAIVGRKGVVARIRALGPCSPMGADPP